MIKFKEKFSPDGASRWIKNLEQVFRFNRMTSNEVRFRYAANLIPNEYLRMIQAEADSEDWECLKEGILRCWPDKSLPELLAAAKKLEMVDNPKTLLQRMGNLLHSTLTDLTPMELMEWRGVFAAKLPAVAQTALSTMPITTPLAVLAERANDAILHQTLMDANVKGKSGGTETSGISTAKEEKGPQWKTVEATMAKHGEMQVQAIAGIKDLLKEMSGLKQSGRIQFTEKSADQSKDTEEQDERDLRFCWFHRRFKGKAYKCKETMGGAKCRYLEIRGGKLAKPPTRKTQGADSEATFLG